MFTNFCGTFDIQSSSRLALQGGELVYCNRGSVFPLRIHTGGAVDLHDGDFYFPHHGYNYYRDINLLGGSLVLSNMTSASGGTFSTGTGGGLIFGSGETVVAGTSGIPEMLRGSIYLVPNGEGETAHLTMKDTAYFPDSHANRHFMMGSTSGGKALFDYEAGVSFPSKALRMTVGNLSGEAEFNVKAGTFKVASEGFAVATCVASVNDPVFKYSQTTGVVAKATVAAGASLPISGSLDAGWGANKRICGISVGYGNVTVTPGRPFEGEMHVAGTVTNDAGCTVIGAGTGTGLYVQDGGETHLEQCASWGLHAVTAIGLMGGKGTLVVSNGTFKIAQSKLFVGGCLPSEILSYANAAPHGQVAWTAEGLPADAHDAQGKVVVAGGTLSAAGDVIVGSDGAGEIEMDGTSGTFTAGNLVLSNATSSVVRFVAGAAGFSPVNVTGKLAVTDGTRIEVDLSDYTGSAKKHRLFTAGSFEGNFDNVELVVRDGNGEVHKPFSLNKSATTLDLCFISGTAILFR